MVDTKQADEALNAGEEETLDTSPVAEEPAEEAVAPEEGKTAETEEKVLEGASEEEEAKKKGYSQRVRELVKQRNEEKARAQSLAERLAALTQGSMEPQVSFPSQPVIGPIARPGEELDAEELERRVQAREQQTLQKADALAILRTKQQDAINRINREADEALKAYPELDPESKDFDEELSESVTAAVEAHIRANPYGASVKNFVGRLMKPYKRAVTREIGEATGNLAKQVSEAALRPTSIKPKEKSADEKTAKELEEELGVVY